jgi:hypothetical protein
MFSSSRFSALALISVLLVACFPSFGEDMKAEDVLKHHLDSIGPADARAALKSRAVQGSLKFRIQVGGGSEVTGTWGLVSEQNQSRLVMRFSSGGDWRGEQFVFDGSKTQFISATSSHTRSVFAQFVSSQDFIIKEGLLGGVLTTGWALENLERNHAKLQSIGRRKIDGRELIGLQYFSKGTKDVQVKLYFDPENYHHVMTVYSLEIAPNMGREITESAYQHENRYTIEERFSDFQSADGLTLPGEYRLQYTQEVQTNTTGLQTTPAMGSTGNGVEASQLLGTTRVYDWQMKAEQVSNNVGLDPGNFKVK